MHDRQGFTSPVGRSIQSLDPMSSIGLIFRCDCEADEMASNFVPRPLGSRNEVLSAISELTDPTLSLRMTVEEESESPEPRTISVSGTWADQEMSVIRRLCDRLKARFYDAETCDFLV
jgi:hypothetical protein